VASRNRNGKTAKNELCRECEDNGSGPGKPAALVLTTIKIWVGGGIVEHAVTDLKGVLSGVSKALNLGDLVLDVLKKDGFSDRYAAEIHAIVNKRLNK